MSIPNSQLDTWANQGAITTSSLTYQSLKNALSSVNSPVAQKIASGLIKVDLQGSYAHDTNIYGDSDVDVIVCYTDTFYSNKEQLPIDQYQLHQQYYSNASFTLEHLRNDVVAALSLYYGENMIDPSGNKSIKVLPSSNRLRLDIVPSVMYRKYQYFHGPFNYSMELGISFKNIATGELIVNYPDQHYRNAVTKHSLTSKKYKGLVRIFKNMRSYLVNKGNLSKAEAPSYFIQSMIYNIPENIFTSDNATTVYNALLWLSNANMNSFINQNEQHLLLGASSTFWDATNASKTITELVYLWNNWNKF